MADKNRIEHVTQKYRLRELISVESGGIEAGPVMDQATFQRLVDSDPSGNGKYLDWMFFIAGGGQMAMDKIYKLWHGTGPDDEGSLRNQYKADFIEERIGGYYDAEGKAQAPVSLRDAEAAWVLEEPRVYRETCMGDQDICHQGGFGFYRSWPGRDQLYAKVAAAIDLWHKALPKLKSINNEKLKKANPDDPKPDLVELDIYAGWKPESYSQAGAVYKNLRDLMQAISQVRRLKVLDDIRYDTVYEDESLLVVCPLTIGASLRYGHTKWCTANRSEFERSFEACDPMQSPWYNYCAQGVVLYFRWKVLDGIHPSISQFALHIPVAQLRSVCRPYARLVFIDLHNKPGGVRFSEICSRITGWNTGSTASNQMRRLSKAMVAISEWAAYFDHRRVVANYTAELTEDDLVNKA